MLYKNAFDVLDTNLFFAAADYDAVATARFPFKVEGAFEVLGRTKEFYQIDFVELDDGLLRLLGDLELRTDFDFFQQLLIGGAGGKILLIFRRGPKAFAVIEIGWTR